MCMATVISLSLRLGPGPALDGSQKDLMVKRQLPFSKYVLVLFRFSHNVTTVSLSV